MELQQFVQKTLELMGFHDTKVSVQEEHHHGTVFIYNHEELVKRNLPEFIESINHLCQQVACRSDEEPVFFDINNYRREREALIAELARTAARKVGTTGTELSLPVMNSYERRLVHVELAANPTVKTESVGDGKSRYVVIRPIIEETKEM